GFSFELFPFTFPHRPERATGFEPATSSLEGPSILPAEAHESPRNRRHSSSRTPLCNPRERERKTARNRGAAGGFVEYGGRRLTGNDATGRPEVHGSFWLDR